MKAGVRTHGLADKRAVGRWLANSSGTYHDGVFLVARRANPPKGDALPSFLLQVASVSSGRLGGGPAPRIDSVGGTRLELEAETKITTKRALARAVSSLRARVVENVGGEPCPATAHVGVRAPAWIARCRRG